MRVVEPVTILPENIVESNLFDVAPTAYAAGTTYALGDYVSVVGTLGEILIYKSLQAGNVGHTPSSSPAWWVYSSSTYTTFAVNSVYNLSFKVFDSTSKNIYESLITDNYSVLDKDITHPWAQLGVSPVTSVPPAYSSTTTYSAGQLVSVADVNIQQITIDYWVYKSVVDGNVGNIYANPTYWELQLNYPVPYNSLANFRTDKQVYTKDGSLWKSLIYYNRNNDPTTTINNWLRVSPSNRTAMFDNQSFTTSVANKEIKVTIPTGIIDTVALVNVNAEIATVTVRNGLGGDVIYTKTVGLTGGNPTNAWDYYFSDPLLRTNQYVFDGILPFVNSHVTLELTGSSEVSIGNLIVGKSKDLGLSIYGAQAGILDFSSKTTDSFGNTSFLQKGYKKTLSIQTEVNKADINRVQRLLYNLRAIPALWISTSDPELSEPLVLFGFYKDFSTDISYPTHALCSIEVEGLV